jgi:N utilization substance protein A
MLDLKALKIALDQLETERKIPREKIVDAIEQALAAAYKKDYGKRGQIVRAQFDLETGRTDFFQIKIVVDDSTVYFVDEGEDSPDLPEGDERVRFNAEHHILLEDARIMKSDAVVGEEIAFPLEAKEDYGRIAAQTAKQVIIQRIREAEHGAIMAEFGGREGDIVSGIIQKMERGNLFIDVGRMTAILPKEEQIPNEFYRRGERLRAYLYAVEESPRGISLKVSRTHPKFITALFAQEAPEVASGTVEIKSIAREAGSRTKIAVFSADENVDPVGSCVGQRGIRVTTVMSELGAEKIDIIEWSADASAYVAASLSPAKALSVKIQEEEHTALVEVADDQLSLAIGKGGQNVRLAAKLTGWKIDIKGVAGEIVTEETAPTE